MHFPVNGALAGNRGTCHLVVHLPVSGALAG